MFLSNYFQLHRLTFATRFSEEERVSISDYMKEEKGTLTTKNEYPVLDNSTGENQTW